MTILTAIRWLRRPVRPATPGVATPHRDATLQAAYSAYDRAVFKRPDHLHRVEPE